MTLYSSKLNTTVPERLGNRLQSTYRVIPRRTLSSTPPEQVVVVVVVFVVGLVHRFPTTPPLPHSTSSLPVEQHTQTHIAAHCKAKHSAMHMLKMHCPHSRVYSNSSGRDSVMAHIYTIASSPPCLLHPHSNP